MQDSIPLTESLPLVFTVTSVIYQPFAPAVPAVTDSDADDALASYWSANEPLAALPALSVQLPAAEAAALSGPLKVADVQLAIPDVASSPLNVVPTGVLYQPL